MIDNLQVASDSWALITNANAVLRPTAENLTDLLGPYVEDVASRVDDFADPAFGFEIGRFVWVWVQVGLCVGVIVFALAGYMPFKCLGIVIASSLIVLIFFAEVSALLAYSSSELLVMTDVCEQLYKIHTDNRIPYRQTGIAYYLAPMTPVCKFEHCRNELELRC